MTIFYVIQNYETLEYLEINSDYNPFKEDFNLETEKYIFTTEIKKAYKAESLYECEKFLENYLEYFDSYDDTNYIIIKLYKY